MKVVICGAGQVGFHLARYLSGDGNDITVIDTSQDVIQHVTNTLDVQGIHGSAAHPETLAMAGAQDAEMLIAVTQQDEINMVACQVAYSLFDTPTKIARIRDQRFLSPRWSTLFAEENIPVDFIISPELEVAKAMKRTLEVQGAFEVFDLANGLAKAIGIRAAPNMPILRTPLKHLKTLFPEVDMSVMAIIRDKDLILPAGEDIILPGDSVYILVDAQDIHHAMRAFSHEDNALSRIIVLGSGGIGLRLCEILTQGETIADIRIVEKNRERANFVAKEVSNAIVIHGDALDVDILREAGADRADAVVAITNDDKINVLSALLTKSLGTKRAVALVNEMTFSTLMYPIGMDAIISPRAITVSSILQYVRRGRIKMAYAIQEAKGEIIDIEVFSTSLLIGKELSNIGLPKAALVAAIARADQILPPKPNMVIETGDRLLMMVAQDAIKKVEMIFSARI
jgi:trk system potassium uptake protein TrkA